MAVTGCTVLQAGQAWSTAIRVSWAPALPCCARVRVLPSPLLRRSQGLHPPLTAGAAAGACVPCGHVPSPCVASDRHRLRTHPTCLAWRYDSSARHLAAAPQMQVQYSSREAGHCTVMQHVIHARLTSRGGNVACMFECPLAMVCRSPVRAR